MKLTSDQLKALRQRATARSAGQRADCLSAEVLWQAAAGKLHRRERAAVLAHLATCSDCAEEYRLGRSLKGWAREAAASLGEDEGALENEPDEWPTRWPAGIRAPWGPLAWPRWRALAVAATLVVAIGLPLAVWRAMQRGPEPVPTERRGAAAAITVDPADRAVLNEPPRRLSWSALEGADRYQVVLYDFEATRIWESPPVTTPAVILPDSVRERLPHGQPVYWRVVAHQDVERRQSDVFQFVISP